MGLLLGSNSTEISASVQSGILQINSQQGGSGEVTIHCDRATQNTDSSLLDLKCLKLTMGTTSGGGQVGSIDFSTTGQEGAHYFKVTGLLYQPYFFQLSCLNSADVESSKSELMLVPEPTYTPTRSYTNISSTTTISTSGDYLVTASFTGKITVAADGVYINGQGFTITHSSDYGIEITGTRDHVEIDNLVFNNTGTTRDNIFANWSSITNLSIHDCTGDGPGTDTCFIRGTSQLDAGGAWIYNNTHQIDGDSGTARDTMFIHELSNFLSWNNTITMSNGGRDGGYSQVDDCVIWANTFTAQNPDQGTFISNRNTSGGIYIHNNTLNYESGQSNSHRMLFFDGDSNTACLWNTIDLNTPGTPRAWRIRNTNGNPANQNNIFGFNTVDCRNDGDNVAVSFGGNEGPSSTGPGNGYAYHNTVNNAVRAYETYESTNGTITTWENDNFFASNEVSLSGDTHNWTSNNDTFGGTIETPASGLSGTWNVFGGYVIGDVTGQTSHINFNGSWTGYDPTTKTPNAPSNITRAIQPFYPTTIDDRGSGNDQIPDAGDFSTSIEGFGTGDDRYYQGTGGSGSIVRFGNTLYAYYIAGDSLESSPDGDARGRKVLMRKSTDNGSTWDSQGTVVIDFVAATYGFDGPDSPDSEEGCFTVTVTLDEDGLFIAFVGEMGNANAGNVNTQIGLWTSSDGENFTRSQTIFDYNETDLTGSGDEIWPFDVFFDGSNWHMYYGSNGFHLNYIQSSGASYTSWDKTSDSQLLSGTGNIVVGANAISLSSSEWCIGVTRGNDNDIDLYDTTDPGSLGSINKTWTASGNQFMPGGLMWDQLTNKWRGIGTNGSTAPNFDLEVWET